MNEMELLSRYGRVEPMDSSLIDATVEAVARFPDPAAGARGRLSGPRRRRSFRQIAIGSSMAAAVAAGAAFVIGLSGSSSPRPGPQVAQSQERVLTGYVVDHSLAALETARGYVERVVRHDGSDIPITWIGPDQLLEQVPGQTSTLWTWAPSGVDTVLNVDYQRHTWSRSVIPAPPPPPRPTGGRQPSPAAVVQPPKALNGAEPSAASIAGLFRQPGTEVIGTATIDSTDTYELRIPALDVNGRPITEKAITAWVDTRTFLPVRIARDAPATVPAWTEDFTWEPATPRALAVFDLTPPAFFHQTADPALQPLPPGNQAKS